MPHPRDGRLGPCPLLAHCLGHVCAKCVRLEGAEPRDCRPYVLAIDGRWRHGSLADRNDLVQDASDKRAQRVIQGVGGRGHEVGRRRSVRAPVQKSRDGVRIQHGVVARGIWPGHRG
ncbi:hypothetical protein GLX27_004572 [Malassezia furfur]|uniref:Uncharacterized protein n=1 Tax=Malassezia furfur TaxID=55194 RepID=A0ABY8EWE1_MALFU|nr:hypothetical protein GLX27_004572 [Malassezia furfur]